MSDARTCEHCGKAHNRRGGAKWCSPACRSANWYRRNPDYSARHYAANRAAEAARAQEYRERTRDERLAYDARYRAENAAVRSAWWARNRSKRVEYQAKRNARQAQAPGAGCSAEQFAAMIADLADRCAYCARDGRRLTVDHVLALSRGGRHDVDNIVPACGFCNSSKGDRAVQEWLPGWVPPPWVVVDDGKAYL